MGSTETILVSKVESAAPPLMRFPTVTNSRLIRPPIGARHLGEFDVELRRFDGGARRLDSLLGFALLGGPRVNFLLGHGPGFDQLLSPSEILLGPLVSRESLLGRGFGSIQLCLVGSGVDDEEQRPLLHDRPVGEMY